MPSSTLPGDLIRNLQLGTNLNIAVPGFLISGTLTRVGNDYVYLEPIRVPIASILYIEEVV